jgi:hypothetical protein
MWVIYDGEAGDFPPRSPPAIFARTIEDRIPVHDDRIDRQNGGGVALEPQRRSSRSVLGPTTRMLEKG